MKRFCYVSKLAMASALLVNVTACNPRKSASAQLTPQPITNPDGSLRAAGADSPRKDASSGQDATAKIAGSAAIEANSGAASGPSDDKISDGTVQLRASDDRSGNPAAQDAPWPASPAAPLANEPAQNPPPGSVVDAAGSTVADGLKTVVENVSSIFGLMVSTVCTTDSFTTCVAKFTGGSITSPVIMPVAAEPTDASHLITGKAGGTAVDLVGAPGINDGSFVGGLTGTERDAGNGLNLANQTPTNSFDIPSGGKPSPLFGAQPWAQKLLLVEEFGTEDVKAASNSDGLPLPVASTDPTNPELSAVATQSAPDGQALDKFLSAPGLYPFPSRLANTELFNPWWSLICTYIKSTDCKGGGPIEGRPSGEGWGHQRWQEFYPVKVFKTAQAGSRVNTGARDARQRHGYKIGEFGPGGLYNTVGGNLGSAAGVKIRFHPDMPIQNHQAVWTFDGTLPIKLLNVRYGEPTMMRHYNALPIDVAANRGFGLHTITTHEHNGHNPAESDGYAGAFFFPGQYYDYRWPVLVPGHDTMNTAATDDRASTPCVKGETMRVQRQAGPEVVACDVSADPDGQSGKIRLRGDYREMASSHWFHDHMLDFTSQNVYKGNAAVMNYYSAVDRGNETIDDGVNLRLPSGSGLSWGNRDYDVNLVMGDKAWDSAGQLWFDIFNRNGFLGDQLLVNFQYKPSLDVRARRYRFRLLNGAVARFMKVAVVREVQGNLGSMPGPAGSNLSYEAVPFYLVANDGNIMEHSVAFDGSMVAPKDSSFQAPAKGILPIQGIGERYDIVIDFAANGIQPGDKLFFVNVEEHKTGKRPENTIPLANILSGAYKPVATATSWTKGDPAVGMFLRLDVQPCVDGSGKTVTCKDPSMNPADYVAGNHNGPNGSAKTMMLRPDLTPDDLKNAIHRSFVFGRKDTTDAAPWVVKTDGGQSYVADLHRISAAPNLGALNDKGLRRVEIWHLESGKGWTHPVHIHFEEGQVLSRDGKTPPVWEQWARKDIYRIGDGDESSGTIDIALRFREFSGSYMEHCHNTVHEDHSMLVRWDIERPGQTLLMPSPVPSWYGVNYADSVAEATFRTGDGR